MKALVTGGAGFIGSNLVKKLISQKVEVVVIDNLLSGIRKNIPKGVKFYKKDIGDNLDKIFQKEQFKVVFHLAGQISVSNSVKDPVFDCKVNVLGSVNLINTAIRHKVKKFIFSSSAACYGNPVKLPLLENFDSKPLSPYGMSKLCVEKYLQMYRESKLLDSCVLRYANVYGYNQRRDGEAGVISIFMENAMANKPLIIYGDGFATRDFVFVEDVVDANINAITQGNEVFNIGSGKNICIRELALLIKNITGSNSAINFENVRAGDIQDSSFSISKANRKLKWKPNIYMAEGLRLYFDSLRKTPSS